MIKEVGGSDSNGVGGPEFETGIIFIDVKHQGGAAPEMGCHHGGCDVLLQAARVFE